MKSWHLCLQGFPPPDKLQWGLSNSSDRFRGIPQSYGFSSSIRSSVAWSSEWGIWTGLCWVGLLLVLLGYSVKSPKSSRRGQTQGTSTLQASVTFVSHFCCPAGHCKSSGQSQRLTQKVLHRGVDTRRTTTVTIFVTHLFAEEKERKRDGYWTHMEIKAQMVFKGMKIFLCFI